MKKAIIIILIACSNYLSAAKQLAAGFFTVTYQGWSKEVAPGNALKEYPRPQMGSFIKLDQS